MTAQDPSLRKPVLPTGRGAVTRFAPSPTGHLHIGHARSALFGFALAHRLGGRFLLRIEDIDPDRCRPELIGEICDVLRWLGLRWEEPVLRQSEHVAVYEAAAMRLKDMGLLYPCFASRAEIEAAASPGLRDPDGAPIYPGLHRGMRPDHIAQRKAAGQPFAMRLDMQAAIHAARAKADSAAFGFWELDRRGEITRQAIDPARWGDVVLQRKTLPTSYHLSVVVDDARQGISLVTRGEDLRAATDIHRLLQILLDLPEPIYAHHPLILAADGRKLAKRDGSPSLADLRARGLSPQDVRHMAGMTEPDLRRDCNND